MLNSCPSVLLARAVDEFAKLPAVGQKTAMRLVLHLLDQETEQTEQQANALLRPRREARHCQRCHMLCDDELCAVCQSHRRDERTLCVVADVRDVMAIENTAQYRGLYHVLGGVISPIDGVGPAQLHIDTLLQRLEREDIAEVILALSPTVEGDTTSLYIARRIGQKAPKLSMIARGVAQNDELQYADEVTLGRSIVNRQPYEVNL